MQLFTDLDLLRQLWVRTLKHCLLLHQVLLEQFLHLDGLQVCLALHVHFVKICTVLHQVLSLRA
jgi:hypothetical protein